MTYAAMSLCSGYLGLDQAADAAFGPAELRFVADISPAAQTFLAHRRPDVPNLGDITAVDWTQHGPIDRITAGYPCQPLSLAGRRVGLNDERWLWDDGVFPAIRDLRPGIVVLENVPGHLSLGFGRVLGDLASIGYDASWTCVRASDVGAPHRRERVFIVAQPADSAGIRHGHTGTPRVGRLPAAAVAGGAGADGVSLLPTPTVADSRGTRNATSGRSNADSQHHDGWTLGDIAHADRWGEYAPAIARWETVTGRPAPDPTEPGKTGRRLSPRFVEWLMGCDAGWVCDVPGLTRNRQLHLLGNGVVPQQGAYGIALAAAQLQIREQVAA